MAALAVGVAVPAATQLPDSSVAAASFADDAAPSVSPAAAPTLDAASALLDRVTPATVPVTAPTGAPSVEAAGEPTDVSATATAAAPLPDRTAPVAVPLPAAKDGIQTLPLAEIVAERTTASDAAATVTAEVDPAATAGVDPAAPSAADTPVSSPVTPGVTPAATPAIASEPADGLVAVTTLPARTDGFTVAGVTWPVADQPEAVRLRAYVDGAWTDWRDLEIAARSGGPVPGSAEDLAALGGTEPFVAVDATGVQIQVISATGELPDGVAAQLVNPQVATQAAGGDAVSEPAETITAADRAETAGTMALAASWPNGGIVERTQPYGPTDSTPTPGPTPTDPVPPTDAPRPGPTETPVETQTPTPPPATVSTEPVENPTPTPTETTPAPAPVPTQPTEPVIRDRSEWGANEARVDENPKYFSTLRGAIVHHTAGSNNYTEEQVPAVIRSVFNYHVGSLKWNDIGYNFLIDKYGGIWEGRAGGITENVIGAHANHFNSETFGVSVLGDYEKTEPTAQSIAALTSLVSWRLAVGGIIDPGAETKYATNGKTLPVIIGHKDAVYSRGGVTYNATDCPGKYLYPYLDTLRAGAVYPVVNRPGIAGPSDVLPGAIGTYTVTWDSTSGPVTGITEVQRFNGTTWTPMAQINVVNGVGQWQLRPSGVYTYRAVARSVAEPAGWRLPAKTASASLVTTRVISRGATKTPRLLVPSYATAGKNATVVALWNNPYKGKPDKLQLQVRKGGKWVKVKNVTVDGVRIFKIKVTASAKYRLKAVKESAPARGKLRASKTVKIRAWQ